MKNEPLLLRPVEAAEMLAVSRSRIYELINAGSIPAVRLGESRSLRVPLAALRRLIEEQTGGAKGGESL